MTPIKVYRKSLYSLTSIIDMQSITTINKNKDCDFYFLNNNECYYMTYNGEVINHIKPEEGKFIKANKYLYVIYNKEGNSIDVFSPKNEFMTNIKTYGYPYIIENLPLVIVINLNGLGFSIYSINGTLLVKEINFPSIITSISMDKSYNILVSTLDGESIMYSSNGKQLFETTSSDSRICIAKSNTIDFNNNFFAIASGLYPEFIKIYNKNNFSLIKKIKTDSNLRYSNYMKISNKKVYYEGNGTIEYFDIKNNRSGKIKINGEIKDISINDYGDILVSSVKGNIKCLTLYSQKGYIKFYKEFNENIDNILFYKSNTFYFKLSNNLFIMNLGAKK